MWHLGAVGTFISTVLEKARFPCLVLHFYLFLYFHLCGYCSLDFSEHLLSFTCILACPSTVLVFISISLLLHAWNYFARTVVDSATRLTHMHVVSFFESVICRFHALSLTYAYTQYHHEFTHTFTFSHPSASLANLGLDSASPNNIAQSWDGRLCLPLHKCAFLPKNCPPGLFCAFLRDSDCWPRKLRNAVTELVVIASWDCVLCNSSNQQLVFWSPGQNYTTLMISDIGMLKVSFQVHFVFY